MAERRNRTYKQIPRNLVTYVYATNFDPFIKEHVTEINGEKQKYVDNKAKIYTVTTGDVNYNKIMEDPDINYIIDTRCNLLSIDNDTTTSLDFYYNYLRYNAYLANNAGKQSTTIPYLEEENKDLRKYINYGYIPIIFLPTPEINKWKAEMLARIEAMHLEYISLPTQGFIHSHREKTRDVWVHRLDLHKVILPDVAPENITMEMAARAVFRV